MRSNQAGRLMKEKGFQEVSNLEGGISAWTEELEKGLND
jgi:rhodanese-related sulfurtransferase